MLPVIFGLGSNLAPEKHLNEACQKLKEHFAPLKISRIYQSAPYHHLDQPPYLNQVITGFTAQPPLKVLDLLLQIEASLGRVRGKRHWENRSIDIDILDFAGKIEKSERLILPHYDLAGRDFFLLPLLEVAPSYLHPVSQKDIATMLSEIPESLRTGAMPIP